MIDRKYLFPRRNFPEFSLRFLLAQSPLLRVVKLEQAYNHLLCYCQLVTDQADLVLLLDPTNEQIKDLAVNQHFRIAGDSR